MDFNVEIAVLSIGVPRDDAGAEAIAAWLRAQAVVHEHRATQGGPDHSREHALAALNLENALQLLRTCCKPCVGPGRNVDTDPSAPTPARDLVDNGL